MKPEEAKQLKAGDIVVLKSGIIGQLKDDFPHTDEACRLLINTGTGTSDLIAYYESLESKLDINFIPIVGQEYEFQYKTRNRGWGKRFYAGYFNEEFLGSKKGQPVRRFGNIRQIPNPKTEPESEPLERFPKTYAFLIDPKNKDAKGNPKVVGFIHGDACWFIESNEAGTDWYKAPASECCRYDFVTGDKCVKVPIEIDKLDRIKENKERLEDGVYYSCIKDRIIIHLDGTGRKPLCIGLGERLFYPEYQPTKEEPKQEPTQQLDEITPKIKDILIYQLGVSLTQVKEESSIIDDLGADSLDILELVMEIEDAFKIEISNAEVEKVKTVGDLVSLVKSKLYGIG